MKSIIYAFSVSALIFVGLSAQNSFRDPSTLMDEGKIELGNIDYSAEPAGLSKRFDRSYENAPPLIPHDLEGLVPITKDLNMCVTCHMPEFSKDVNSTAIPKTHLVDLRSGEDNHGELESSRYDCTLCHVPQANTTPLVKNNFRADFRDKNAKNTSNLIDVLNEGVK